MYIDILYINGHPYLHTKTKEVNYITISRLKSRKMRDIKRKLKDIIKKYLTRGFILTDIFGDNEFASPSYENLFLPATLHICSKGEHVSIIERSIRIVKERARAATVHLPYSKVPLLMTVSLLEGVDRWLNMFSNSIADFSPSTLVDGRNKPGGDINCIPYGAYALVYSGTKNNMDSRTVPAIALRETNSVGGYYIMSLETGKRIHGNKWERMNITDEVVKKVLSLAETEGQPWLHEYPFTVDSEELSPTNEVCEIDVIPDKGIDKIPTIEERTEDSAEIIEDNVEIKERVRTTLDHLNIDDTNDEHESENNTISDDYSGTTIKASDSTYIPENGDVE